MRTIIFALIMTASAFATPPVAKGSDDRDLFDLWTRCGGLDLVVAPLDDEETAFGLTEERVERTVRSRLRAARIYDGEQFEYLWVKVFVVGEAFQVQFDFNKALTDLRTDISMVSSTWTYSFLGTHGRSDDYIMASVSEATDLFIDDYLRVNSPACTGALDFNRWESASQQLRLRS